MCCHRYLNDLKKEEEEEEEGVHVHIRAVLDIHLPVLPLLHICAYLISHYYILLFLVLILPRTGGLCVARRTLKYPTARRTKT